MTPDETLYRKYINGDESGLRALMERHGDSLTLYLYGFTHNMHDAEDLMIEAFARVVHTRPVLGGGRAFQAYLYKTARNLATRFHERMLRRNEFSLETLNREPESTDIIESVLTTSERDRTLHACMQRLEPQVREALWLVYFEGLSYEEASRVMKKKTKQVDYLLQKGRNLLKNDLMKEGVTDAQHR